MIRDFQLMRSATFNQDVLLLLQSNVNEKMKIQPKMKTKIQNRKFGDTGS